MIKVKDGYAKLIGTTTTGSASHLLLSNGGIKAVSDFAAASALDNYLPLSGGTLNITSGSILGAKYAEDIFGYNPNYGTYIGGNGTGSSPYTKGYWIYAGNDNSPMPKFCKGTNIYKIWCEDNDGSGSGLDADLLDGIHASSMFYAKNKGIDGSNINTTLANGVYFTGGYAPVTGAYQYGTLLCFRSGAVDTNSRQTQFYISDGQNATGGIIYYRDAWNSTSNITSGWHRLARVTDNVASATKLQTARTIWGQSFDGTGNISGEATIEKIHLTNTFINLNRNGSTGAIYDSTKTALEIEATKDLSILRTYNVTTQASIVLHKNGNIGIGTDTPPKRLTVAGGPILQLQKNTWLNTANLMLGRSDATIYTDKAVIGVTNGNLHLDSYSGYAMYFNHYVGSTAGLSKGMVLTSSGYLGIGVEPSQKLHVNGLVNITANEKTVTIGSQNTSHCHYSTTAPNHWFNKDVRVAGHIYGGSDYNRRVAYADELHSKDAGAIEGSITNSGAYSYSSTRYGIWYQNHYSGHGLGNYRGVLSCRDSGVGFELNSYWCVNPSDSANLNNLYFRVKRDAASDWGPYSRIVTLSFSGSIYADHFYEHSDATLKTNIKTINTSDNIPQLKSFDWKENGKHSYGLIALELEEMGYVELVEESNGKKTVQYSAALSLIVGKLLVKIQEIEKENKELRDELNNLKNNKLWQS